MWVFFIVFAISQIYQFKNKLLKALDDVNKEEEENNFAKEELLRLKVNEQKLKNHIAYEKLALDQEKRYHAQALHELKKQTMAKQYDEELREPSAWFSQSAY